MLNSVAAFVCSKQIICPVLGKVCCFTPTCAKLYFMQRELTNLQECKQLYTELLANYKTVSSKKAFLSRSIKKHVELLEDIKQAANGSGWLYGERVYKLHVVNAQQELQILNNLKNNL